ncbi:MAG TPA: glycoside hydrolase family 3 N-terminal domain-containing protein, partial [Burkholderiaceae bacterium]|nr:glycoside hydrolase family 3 N-terminal domain-containing protein [Burkholderiaceae bacterium]
GHGWAKADSHVALPVDPRSCDEIMSSDAAPYRWLGLMLAGVMPAHVVYSQVDQRPAGFSQTWIKKILREELGFTGAVFSDDLLMEGAGVVGDAVDRAAAAFSGGCDFVLVCNQPAAMDRVLEATIWQRNDEFDVRCERLVPRGYAPSITELRKNDTYRNALDDVSELAETH